MSARPRRASVSFRAHGHPGIAGTHDKTLEFTRDCEVTRRATCVLGVGSEHDDALLRLRGDVEVTIECRNQRDAFEATVTPFFLGDDSLVFRRGAGLRGRTFAFGASKSAADIDRALVRTLAEPSAEIRVTVHELSSGDRRGALFVVAVPIGNDDDLSPRARRVLEVADIVLAEDTRRFRDLVARASLRVGGSIASYHDHNEQTRSDDAIAQLAAGARVALVSDAGTPLFSDPGYVVVRRAIDAGFDVSPVPGPSSILAVLSASGLPVDRFLYAGFVPRRSAARRAELGRLVARGETFVLHEAPHRVAALTADLAVVAPEWQVCVGREATKVFEEFRRGTARELASAFASEEPRGEFTLVVGPPDGASPADATSDEHIDRLLRLLLAEGVTPTTLTRALAALPGVSRKAAYARVLAIADEQ